MFAATILALGLAASPATASPAPPTVSEVVVQPELEEAVRKFVEEVAEPGYEKQLPQWRAVICPGVIGLKPDQNAFFARRLVRDASRAGIQTPKKACTPNVMVVFTDQSDAFSQMVTKRHPGLFRNAGSSWSTGLRQDRDAFKVVQAPVRWWVVTRLAPSESAEFQQSGNEPPIGRGRASGIVGGSRVEMARVLVVVDTARVGKVTYNQIAGYLAMVALSRTRQGADVGPDSILSLFDESAGGEGAPADLTAQDRTYLASLQRTPGELRLYSQKRMVAGRMARTLSDETPE